MSTAQDTRDEAQSEPVRLAALERYGILDTPPEPAYDDATALVRVLCQVPIALVSLVDRDRQWFKSHAGTDLCETPRETSVCALAIRQHGLFEIPDLSADLRTAHMSLVAGEGHLRFYAGVPLITSDGHALGSLCAIDTEPRPQGLTPEQAMGLMALARQVTAQIELRAAIDLREQALVQQARRQEKALADATILDTMLRAQARVLESGGNLNATMHAFVEAALQAVHPADGVVLELLRGDYLVYEAAAGSSARWQGVQLPVAGTLSGRALRERTALLTDDAWEDSRAAPDLVRKLGLRSMIVVPLTRHGQSFGVLKLHSAQAGAFRSRHVLIGQMLAGLISASFTEAAELTVRRDAAASEERFRRIIDSADDTAIVSTDADGRIVDWSRGAAAVFGYGEADICGQPAARLFTPEDRLAEAPMRLLRQAARGRATAERWHLRSDGSRFYGQMTVTPLAGPEAGFVMVLRDVTEEYRTRQDLADSRERLEGALETGLIGFFDWDVEADNVRGDRRFAHFFRMAPETLDAGLNADQLRMHVVAEDRDSLRERVVGAVAQGADYAVSFRVDGDEDEPRWLLVRARCTERQGKQGRRYFGTVIDISAQKHSEDQLRVERERLELAQRAAKLGNFDYWPQTGRLEWDDRCRALFGLPPGAPIGYEEAFLAGLHPEDRAYADAAVRAALDPAGTGVFDIEYRTIGIADGIERFVAAKGLAFFADGQPVRLVGTVQDVTRERRERAVLRETEERLRLAVRATNDVIWDWDLGRDRVLWNAALHSAYGHPETISVTPSAWWSDNIHQEDRARIVASIHAVIDSTDTDTWTDEYRFRRADGSYADVQDRGYVLRNVAGKAVRMLGAMLDQSDRKTTERLLERAKQGLEQEVAARTAERDQIWSASPDLLCVSDFSNRFLEMNPAWVEALGWSIAELSAMTLDELVHPDDMERTRAQAAVLERGETIFGFENRWRTHGGKYRWLSWNAVPRGDRIYSVVRDVTQAHEQAEALARAEDLLRQSQKMEAVGQLTGGLAHDFNNLLAGISGSIEMMQMRLSQGRLGELERYLGAAQGAARRAAALTHRLLAFSRRQTLNPTATDANRLVAGMEELVRRTVGPQIELQILPGKALWPTLVDANQLENALLNLCINARDAMPDGGKLVVETANRKLDSAQAAAVDLPAGAYVLLSVSDTGTGMTREVMDRAFDPFFTTKPLGQGTGLGLSMIYGFARQSEGQVRISSSPGHGTQVCLYLPRHRGGTEESAVVAADAEVARAEEGETVLVVDDEATVRMLVTDALQDLGYLAVEAADGPAGLRILQGEARVDLLVTDVGLPGGMNGRQLADAARASRPDLKVLFITGYAETSVLGAGSLESGMHVMTKPFGMDALANRIRGIIEG